jgi:hypothetical protein
VCLYDARCPGAKSYLAAAEEYVRKAGPVAAAAEAPKGLPSL